ncbi:MAG: hypothetical protein RL136_857 [Planctomycetota bacterium]|jgi:putative ABC transport system permease protein
MRLLPFDYAVRNLGRSPKRLLLVSGGSALVSLLVLGAVGFGRGMERSFAATGLASNALLIGSGSEESIERSEIPASTAAVLASSVDGLLVVAGRPAVSAEIHAALPAARADAPSGEAAPPAIFRGFDSEAFLVHPQVRLVAGRWPDRGADEVAAGPGALARVGGASIGDAIVVDGRPFTLTGLLEAPGTAMHGEFWMRLDSLAELTQRSTHSCIVAAIGDADFDDIEAFTSIRLDLETIAMRESAYYERLSDFLAPIRMLVIATAALIAVGGVLGGVNAMYAAFASRVREVGTLQALGFTRPAIAISFVLESTIACVAGSLVACAAGAALLDGISIRFTMGSFGIVVDAVAILAGLLAGAFLGLLGAIPAIARCLTLSIPSALRA